MVSDLRAKDDYTYQEYKTGIFDKFNLWKNHNWAPKQVTDDLTEEDNEYLIGTSLALWMIAIARYETEHDILEERVRKQVSYHIGRYEIGKYSDVTDEEKEELEADIKYIKDHTNLYEIDASILNKD